MLSEISQTGKDKYCMMSLTCRMKTKQNQGQKPDWWLPKAGAGGRVGEMGEKGQEVETFSYKIKK